MHHNRGKGKKETKRGMKEESTEMYDECGCCDDGKNCCSGDECGCGSGGNCECGPGGNCSDGVCYCCGPSREMTKEGAEFMLTRVASDIWMEMFAEACRKEWQKKFGKQLQKLAAEHVKKADKEWKEKMK